MEKKQIKINGKIAVEIKINGGLFWKAVGPGPTGPNKLVYSTNAAGSTIKVNGETVTLEQGDNITLDYPNEITSVKATSNKALTYIQIPNTVTKIEGNTGNFFNPNSAFYNCTSLVSVTLPDTLKTVGKEAFKGCTSLVSINIPNSVTSIGGAILSGCTSLIEVTLPDSLTSIDYGILYNCSSLGSINIPDGVTSIGNNAFYGCSSLSSINIPVGVTKINYGVFRNCTALTDLNYSGTKSQWASITKEDDWNLDSAIKVVHCTDGDVNI